MQAVPAGAEVIDLFDSDCDDFDPQQLLSQPPSLEVAQRRGRVHWSGAALKDLLEIGVWPYRVCISTFLLKPINDAGVFFSIS